MANVKSPEQIEADALEMIEKDEELEAVPQHPDNFNIVDGKPLPEGFINPPLGDDGHFCVGPDRCYRADWWQIKIESRHDKEIDPVVFPLDSHYSVYRDHWTDVPACVVISLNDAVEVHHEMNPKAGDVQLGGPETEHREFRRRRFIWDKIRSAQVSK